MDRDRLKLLLRMNVLTSYFKIHVVDPYMEELDVPSLQCTDRQ